MARVTDTEVKQIIDTTRDTSPFIDVATLIVDEQLANSGLSVARFKQIELYLAAHFVAISEEKGNLKRSRIGDASEEYDNKSGVGLELTRYGQQALALDTSGTLRSMARSTQNALFIVV